MGEEFAGTSARRVTRDLGRDDGGPGDQPRDERPTNARPYNPAAHASRQTVESSPTRKTNKKWTPSDLPPSCPIAGDVSLEFRTPRVYLAIEEDRAGPKCPYCSAEYHAQRRERTPVSSAEGLVDRRRRGREPDRFLGAHVEAIFQPDAELAR